MEEYRSRCPTLNISLCWTANRGYHLKYLKPRAIGEGSARKEVTSLATASLNGIKFIRKCELKATVRCTTEQLFSLAERLRLSEEDILERTSYELQQIRTLLCRTKALHYLFDVADKLGELDLVCCIANFTDTLQNLTFPTLSHRSHLKLVHFIHPLACVPAYSEEEAQADDPGCRFVQNTLELDIETQKLALITGPV